jgi:riboflavin biosynthesis pyrimidine reductase
MRRLLPGSSTGSAVDPASDLVEAYRVPAAGPHLRVNFVTSLDGSASVQGLSGGLSNPRDKDVFFTLRGLADVILVGAGTARSEGYGPVKRTATGTRPPIALVSKRLDLDLGTPFFTDAPPAQRPLVLTTSQALDGTDRGALEAVCDAVVCGTDSVDLAVGLAELRSRGLSHVLCEGGPTLFGQLLDDGLVDELDLTIAPLVAGPGGPRIAGGSPLGGAPLTAAPILLLEDAGWLFARYALTVP